VAVPAEWAEAFRAAHTGVAVLEAAAIDPRERLARPGLAGTDLRSRVLTAIDVVDPAQWRLTVAGSVEAEAVADALRGCLGSGDAWPGRLLEAAGRRLEILRAGAELTLRFSAPVGPLLPLLEGCVIPGRLAPGAFRPHAREDGLWTATSEGPGGGPLLDALRLRAGDETADVVFNATPDGPRGDEIQAPSPDVVLLLQSTPARERDPLRLNDEAGVARFLDHVQPELLTAVFWDGRGARAAGILPPGLGPSRPLPRGEAPADAPPLTMRTLPPDAPTVRVDGGGGILEAATRERLVAVLRAGGVRTDADADVGLRVLRWRPPTMEPALALLHLAAEHPDVFGAIPAETGSALLSPDPVARSAAAVSVEATWLRERRVVPLFTAERWISVSPRVRGVRVRTDGVPLLHDAWLAGPR